jgi:hypothetical protein
LYAVSIVIKSSALGRTVGAGLLAAAVVAFGGMALERVRYGASDEEAIARVETEIQQRFNEAETYLATLAGRAAAETDLIRAAPRDPAAAARLFDALDAALPEDQGHTGITVYDAADTPIAWAGRVADPPKALDEPASLILTVGALGPRLVRIQPVVVTPGTRLGTVVAEQILEPIDRAPTLGARFILNTALAPVTLRVGVETTTQTPAVFSITARDGTPLVEAEIAPSDLVEARARWRRTIASTVLGVIAVTLLLWAGLLVEMRRQAQTPRTSLAVAAGIVATLVLSRAVLAFATMQIDPPPVALESIDLLLTSLVAVATVWLVIDLIERRRVARPPAPPPAGRAAPRRGRRIR